MRYVGKQIINSQWQHEIKMQNKKIWRIQPEKGVGKNEYLKTETAAQWASQFRVLQLLTLMLHTVSKLKMNKKYFRL